MDIAVNAGLDFRERTATQVSSQIKLKEFCTNVIEKYCLHMKRKWSRNLSTNVLQSYQERSEQQLYITNQLSLVRRDSYIRNFHNTNKEYWQ